MGKNNPDGLATLSKVSKQPSTAVAYLELDPVMVEYACCPACKSIYPRKPDGTYQSICTHRAAAEEPECRTSLLERRMPSITNRKRKRGTLAAEDAAPTPSNLPIEIFEYQPLHEWLAELLSRPGMEDILDQTWARLESNSDDAMSDIIHGDLIKHFQGHDKNPFLKPWGTEGRYLLSFNVDGFNPLRNKTAGRQYSVQGMYAVLLNLPEHLRYLPGNVYLIGIMPGPDKPSLDAINHMMTPFVDDLVVSYQTGAFITRTHNHPRGRTVRCAVVPIVADMPGGRQMAGFPLSTAESGCTCCHADWKRDLDFVSWRPRSEEEFRTLAAEWLAKTTTKAREKHFKKYGVRHSALLRLPYWNPITMLCPDPMHIWYLGAFVTLCRYIWGMDIELEDADDNIPELPAQVSPGTLIRAQEILTSGSNEKLRSLPYFVLKSLCHSHGIRSSKKSKDIISSLLQLVRILFC